MTMERKSLHLSNYGEAFGESKVLDEATGIVEAIVSVTNIPDHVKDIIIPGAYKDTLKVRNPKVCWGHDWKTSVGKTLEAEELMPGDPRLPEKLIAKGAGGLKARMQFNMETQRGREAFADVKFFGAEGEWSVGYDANGNGGKSIRNTKTGLRELHKMALFEMSPVLFGAAPLTSTLSIKDLTGEDWPEMTVALHRVVDLSALGEKSSESAVRAWVTRRGGAPRLHPEHVRDLHRAPVVGEHLFPKRATRDLAARAKRDRQGNPVHPGRHATPGELAAYDAAREVRDPNYKRKSAEEPSAEELFAEYADLKESI